MKSIWQKVKAQMAKHMPDHIYKMWIEPVHFLKSTPDGMVLICPNNFIKSHVLENFSFLIKEEIQQATGSCLNFLLDVGRETGNGEKSEAGRNGKPDRQLLLPPMNNRPKNGRLLRKDFTFDRFVVGNNNDFAYAAALSLSSQKHPPQNSLYLLSSTGMGKSHLAQAAGHKILSAFPSERVFYVTAEDFTNEMVDAYRKNTIDEFKRRYRSSCDVLLLEDIHLLSGRTRSQEELALTLDYLNENGKKIIYSSNVSLSDIPKMSEPLKSRIAQSLISVITPPDFRTRVRILQSKAKEKAFQVPSEVIEYIANEITDNVRLLESGLIGVTTKSSLLGVPVDLNLAKSVIQNIVTTSKSITIDSIKKVVCKEFGISVKDIVSNSRKQAFVRPRQIAIFLARRHTEHSIETIAKEFNRYHATVIYSINSVEKELKLKQQMQKEIELIEKKLFSLRS